MPQDLPDWTKGGTVPVWFDAFTGSVAGVTKTTTPPPTAQAIEVIAQTAPAGAHVNVQGLVSGIVYLDANIISIGQVLLGTKLDTRDFQRNAIQYTLSGSNVVVANFLWLAAGAQLPANSPQT